MIYFTILHWFTLLIILVVTILLSVIAIKQDNRKILVSMLFSILLVMSMLGVFSMYVLDKYTKKAQLEEVTQKRILISESLNLIGKIRNIGSFDIGTCKLEVKLVNNALSGGNVKGSSIFTPRSGLGDLFKNSDEMPQSTLIQEFVIAKDLRSGELRNFSVSMPYPPNFQKTTLNYKLYCH
ncbi:MAG: DUF2393 family protein [Sulfurospirillum sp.]|nr:DUF2393 family protein [Sulfurospirillum sp.]